MKRWTDQFQKIYTWVRRY